MPYNNSALINLNALKALGQRIKNIQGDITDLNTTSKINLVSAINELVENINSLSRIFIANSRLDVLENAVTQILLTLEDINQYPDYMNFIMENFHDTNQVDITLLRISNIDSENNTLTLEDVTGLIPYSYYTISDGVSGCTFRFSQF